MQKSISFLYIFCLFIITCFGGCSSHKKEQPELHKQSFFSKVKEKYKNKHKTPSDEPINAFDLDNDSMKTFALDDKLEQHQQTSTPAHQSTSSNSLFAWEQLAAEETKDVFKKLFFDFDHYILQPNQQTDLKTNVKHAKKMIKQGKTIVIEGHACHSAGSAIYNLALSEKRARHIAKKFADAGIDAKHIKIAPRGHEMPIRKGGTRAEQAVNRRVEVFAI